MSGNLNGDTAPRGLRNALAIVQASVKKSVKLRRSGFSRAPRSVCKICAAVWDYAIMPPDTLAQVTVCTSCRKELSDGYTALVIANPAAYAFVKSELFKELAGEIVEFKSAANFAEVKKKFFESNVVRGFDVSKMKVGDSFLGCPKCGFTFDVGQAAKPVCPDCKTDMKLHTVTKEDVK